MDRLDQIEARIDALENASGRAILSMPDPGGVTLDGLGGETRFIPYEDLASLGVSELDPRIHVDIDGQRKAAPNVAQYPKLEVSVEVLPPDPESPGSLVHSRVTVEEISGSGDRTTLSRTDLYGCGVLALPVVPSNREISTP